MKNNFFGSKFYNSRLNTVLLLVLIVLMIIALVFMFKNKETYLPSLSQNVKNENPQILNEKVKCEISGAKENLMDLSIIPCAGVNYAVTITGKLKGNYFFEGSAPVRIEDPSGKIVLKTNLTATSDWMTSDYVSFKFTINPADFNPSDFGGDATIIIERDDPSGQGKNLMPIKIPIFRT